MLRDLVPAVHFAPAVQVCPALCRLQRPSQGGSGVPVKHALLAPVVYGDQIENPALRRPMPKLPITSCTAAVLLVVALAVPALLKAQASQDPAPEALHEQLARMDSILFETAFVRCDSVKFRSLFTPDAEFYHDLVGARFREDASTLRGCPREQGVQRVLVPGSLEVYPMSGYGAIQMGTHRFVETGTKSSTIAKFVHLWRYENGTWKLARVLSFDHKPEAK